MLSDEKINENMKNQPCISEGKIDRVVSASDVNDIVKRKILRLAEKIKSSNNNQ